MGHTDEYKKYIRANNDISKMSKSKKQQLEKLMKQVPSEYRRLGFGLRDSTNSTPIVINEVHDFDQDRPSSPPEQVSNNNKKRNSRVNNGNRRGNNNDIRDNRRSSNNNNSNNSSSFQYKYKPNVSINFKIFIAILVMLLVRQLTVSLTLEDTKNDIVKNINKSGLLYLLTLSFHTIYAIFIRLTSYVNGTELPDLSFFM